MTSSTGRLWDSVVSDMDREVYRRAGFGRVGGIGQRPCLLVIDVQYRTMGESPKPILQALDDYPTSCGEYGWSAVANIAQLVGLFRRLGLPIIYPHIAPRSEREQGRFANKMPPAPQVKPRAYEIVEEVSPKEGDILLPKFFASAFYGTALASHLVRLGRDSVIVTGCTTSGCVRATVVDACMLDYRVVVPEDAVFDRVQTSHAVNLFDMASKYADVVPTTEAVKLVSAAIQPN